ncbi:double-strand-break repair protein rad21-like protein 1 isoform X1 [Drosophila gunungcola]|uniref:double-strand-break repair protein rad21-like protein 1 isoform X1 n=1 Tax=Drosophila gunungcola TaxID=103775 RepID=UPI0022E806B5|nr:double-strand-break repair protein rad21-like protein 1 isoform X1 [Drosophila gunungcola]
MFYEHIILAKKGPLARIWLAAHWDKKITKAHVFETNIEKSVEGILQPKVKLALRTSGHLLLGVVRIYSRKAKYLLADCNEAFVKIKMAFRPGMVDLPEGHREANVNAITLPEVFHDFDTALPELNDIDIEAQFSINQSRADEITMREDYGSLSLSLQDDGFGDIGFEAETPEIMRGSIPSNINEKLFDSNVLEIETLGPQATEDQADISGARLDGDGFGDSFGQPELFEDDLFGEPSQPVEQIAKEPTAIIIADDFDEDEIDNCNNVPSPATSCINSVVDEKGETILHEHSNVGDNVPINELTLVQNEDDGFALAPIDATIYKGLTKAKRKRKLIIDEIKNISGEEMKAQLADTSDILTTLDLAPPTKRLMYWKETGGVEKLFSLPSRSIPATSLFNNYNRQLFSHSTFFEDFSSVAPMEILALEFYTHENENSLIIFNKKGRKRKNDLVTNPFLDHVSDSLTQSLEVPEVLREDQKSIGLSAVSLNIATKEQESIGCQNASTLFDHMRSPDLLSLNDMEHFSPINDLPLTPRNTINDMGDDFNQGDSTPPGLDHGHTTPQHTNISEIDNIPNIPTDQISAILNESEEQPLLNENGFSKRTKDFSKGWHNYEIPTFVVQNHSDEQMENETDEQFEERVLNKRAAQLFIDVRAHFNVNDNLDLSQLTSGNTRKQAAQKFYSLLVLKKFKVLHIAQSAPYADISITRGPTFENPKI